DFADIHSDGGPLQDAPNRPPIPLATVSQTYIGETPHAGGIGGQGRYVAVGWEDKGGRVEIYDGWSNLLTRLSIVEMPQPHAAFATLAKLADGRYMLFVAGKDSQAGWLYVSSENSIAGDTRWVRFA